MNATTDKLTDDERQQLMARIYMAMQNAEPELPVEPARSAGNSLEDQELRLDELVRIARRTSADSIEPYLNQFMDDICSKCPVQQSSGYCPLRHGGECVLFRNPRLVIDVIDRFLTQRTAPLERVAVFPTVPRKEHTMLTRILIAVDESAPAAAAVEMGVELASRLNADLALIHVTMSAQPIVLADMAVCIGEPSAVRLEGARAVLKRIRRKMPVAMSVEEFVADGFPADQICVAARDWKADLIIVGTHGRHGVSRFILGSTADAVMRRAGCPVLIAREKSVHSSIDQAKQEEKQAAAV